MLKLAYLTINPHYDLDKIGKYNSNVACFIIDKSTEKVVKVGIVPREQIGQWYQERLATYPPNKYNYFISTLSILGEVTGIDEIGSVEMSKEKFN